MLDKSLLRSFRNWLLKHNDLRDHGYLAADGAPRYTYTNETLQYFRNNPQAAYREVLTPRSRHPERIYRPRPLSSRDIANHVVTMTSETLWIVNKSNVNTLLIAMDVDDKKRKGDAQELAEYLRDAYLGSRGYIEQSRSGVGRHVYFLVDVEYIPRVDVWTGLSQLTELIQQDRQVRGFGAIYDRFLGLPTLWQKPDGRWRIERRGNLLKVPYLSNDEDDLNRLLGLVPLSIKSVLNLVGTRKAAAGTENGNIEIGNGSGGAGDRSTKGDLGVTPQETNEVRGGGSGNGSTKGDLGVTSHTPVEQDAFKKKLACVDIMLRATNGTADLQIVLDEYHRSYHPTGMSEADIHRRQQKLGKILEHRRRTYNLSQTQSRPFKRNEFLALVKQLVPDSAFEWKRRDIINCQRLADFVSAKIQDAFFHKPNGYLGATPRNATLANMRIMRAKGIIDWTINSHQYTRLLQLAVQYGLLEIVEGHKPPVRTSTGRRLGNGRARVIGPGTALSELRAEFLCRYERWKAERTALAA